MDGKGRRVEAAGPGQGDSPSLPFSGYRIDREEAEAESGAIAA